MFTIYLYDFDGDDFDEVLPDSAMTAADYAAAVQQGAVDWRPPIEETLVVLEVEGAELLLPHNPFGRLDELVPQLAEAADRLAQDQLALLRAGDGYSQFFALEPSGDRVLLSVLGELGRPWSAYYPQTPSPYVDPGQPDQAQALYDRVAQHREALRTIPDGMIRAAFFQDVPVDRAALVANLRDQVLAGREALAVLRA